MLVPCVEGVVAEDKLHSVAVRKITCHNNNASHQSLGRKPALVASAHLVDVLVVTVVHEDVVKAAVWLVDAVLRVIARVVMIRVILHEMMVLSASPPRGERSKIPGKTEGRRCSR